MRLSVLRTDPGYDPMEAHLVTVKLDGVELKDCVTADEELGEAHCYTVDEYKQQRIEIRQGKVEIILP